MGSGGTRGGGGAGDCWDGRGRAGPGGRPAGVFLPGQGSARRVRRGRRGGACQTGRSEPRASASLALLPAGGRLAHRPGRRRARAFRERHFLVAGAVRARTRRGAAGRPPSSLDRHQRARRMASVSSKTSTMKFKMPDGRSLVRPATTRPARCPRSTATGKHVGAPIPGPALHRPETAVVRAAAGIRAAIVARSGRTGPRTVSARPVPGPRARGGRATRPRDRPNEGRGATHTPRRAPRPRRALVPARPRRPSTSRRGRTSRRRTTPR